MIEKGGRGLKKKRKERAVRIAIWRTQFHFKGQSIWLSRLKEVISLVPGSGGWRGRDGCRNQKLLSHRRWRGRSKMKKERMKDKGRQASDLREGEAVCACATC